jgi:hypothetical protein
LGIPGDYGLGLDSHKRQRAFERVLEILKSVRGDASISFMKMNRNLIGIRHFIYRTDNSLRAGFAGRKLATSNTTQDLTEDADHAPGQASFEAETHNQSRGDSAWCRWTGFLAGG